jgi:hypothetical protein
MWFILGLAALILWAFPQDLAQNASNCVIQSSPQYLNASLEYLIRTPFTAPSGLFQRGSGDWLWNIGTVSHSLTNHGKSGSVSQSLWLETESFVDLTSAAIGYVGCGAIFHGLTYAATVNGQPDAGDCGLTLSPACSRAMLSAVASAAGHNANSLLSQHNDTHTDAIATCANLAIPIPAACDPFFTRNAFIQTFVFASPDRNSICPSTPASSNFINPLASWSPRHARYSPSSMESCNNLTTAISSIITAMFTNQSSRPSHNYFQGMLSCLRPANVSYLSMPPSGIPNDGAANLNGAKLSLSGCVTSAVASAVPTNDAEELRLMMDWLCILGFGVVFWGVLLI